MSILVDFFIFCIYETQRGCFMIPFLASRIFYFFFCLFITAFQEILSALKYEAWWLWV